MVSWKKFYQNNKWMVWAAGVAIVLSIAVLIVVKDEVTRFTLIMPIFAGFILFSIITTPDEELEDAPKEEKPKKPTKKTTFKKSAK